MTIFDPTIASLEPALNLLRHDWVRKFFFETPKPERLSQLSYALNNPITMSGKLNISSKTEASANTQLQFLFASSFTTGGLTVGFDITDRHLSTSPLSSDKSLAWSVRDDDQGIFLAVAQHSNDELTEIACCTKVTPGCKSMMFILLKTSAFRYIIEHGFDETVVRKNLLQSLYSLDIRPCPSCNTTTLTNCSCRISTVTKKHPSDYESELRILDSYIGAFEGIASLRIYQGERTVSIDNCASTIYTSVTGDMNWKHALGKWAMRETATDCSMNIVKLNMPGAEEEKTDSSPRLSDGVLEVDDIALPDISAGGTDICFDGELMRLISSLHDTGNGELSDRISTCDMLTSAYSIRNAVQTKTATCSEKLTSSEEPMEAAICGGLPSEPRESVYRSGSASPEAHTSTENTAKQNQTTAGPPLNIQPKITNRTSVVEHITTRRLVPIAPGTSISGVRPSKFSDELQRRDEIRKARNRESALRSNEKKRIYLKKLKEDIAAAGKKEASLREKERSLREENIKLRASITR